MKIKGLQEYLSVAYEQAFFKSEGQRLVPHLMISNLTG